MSTDQPNILLLFTDMQRADTIHALGNDTIRTPHLDRLVKEGTAFTNAFSPSPVCVPARLCMHYGLYAQRTGLFTNGTMMDDNGKSYPAVLGELNYTSAAIGKCHFTPDSHALRGFDQRITQEECRADPDDDDYIAWLKENNFDYYEAHGARGDMYYTPQISSLPAEAHPTQWIGDRTIDYINDAVDKPQPWCLFSSFIHPHPPFAPPKPWHKLYRVPDMPLPQLSENQEQLYTWINRLQNRYKYRDRGFDLNLVRLIKAYYYATISFVDYQVGRIMESLEQNGQLDNTLIIFTSDHGEHLGDLGCFGKRSMHDASSRVPLIVRQPDRFPADNRNTTAVSLVDIFPTLIQAAGGNAADVDNDGTDLADFAVTADPDRIVFSQFGEKETGIYMAVNQQGKYVYSAADNNEFFFDRLNDPDEQVNLADTAEAADLKQALKQAILGQLAQTGRTEAYTGEGEAMQWREYPDYDESYLDDPDEKLLFQDYPSYPLNLPGYSD